MARKCYGRIVTYYNCEVWLLEGEEQRKPQGLEMKYLSRPARILRYKESQIPPLGANFKQNNQF